MIREATLEDAADINSLSVALGYSPVTDGVALIRLQQVLASSTDKVWVYQQESQVVGWLHAFIAVRLASAPFMEIGGMVVAPHCRQQGIGRRLVEQAKAWAQDNHSNLRVRCNAKREDTHIFYEKAGFDKNKTQYVFEKA